MQHLASRLLLFVAVTVGIAVAGCSGHGGALPSMPGGMPSSHLAPGKIDPRMAQLETNFVRQLRAHSIAHATLNGVALPKTYAVHRPTGFSSAGGNDSELLGFSISAGGTYTGLLAIHSAYRPNDFTVTFPNGSPSSASFVLAPYGYPPNGSCYAVGSFYASTSSTISNAFLVQNLCSSSTVAYPINDAFKSAFVVPAADGTPSYYTVTFTTDAHPTSSSVWRTWLYDFPASQWVEVAQTTGLGTTTTGGDGFLAHLAQGLCPNIPTIAASNLALFDASTQTFASLQPTMSGGVTSSFVSPGTASCFTDDGTHNGAVYEYGAVPNNEWLVRNKSGTQTGQITEYQVSSYLAIGSITAAPDGNLWFTEANSDNGYNAVGRITPRGAVTEFPDSGGPGAITVGPDENLWYAETYGDGVGQITLTGTITHFPFNDPTDQDETVGMVAGTDGNLWFEQPFGRSPTIWKMTTSGAMTACPTADFARWITATIGPDYNIWFSGLNVVGKIARDCTITTYSITSRTYGIAAGGDGNLWFTEYDTNRIGKITVGGLITEYNVPTSGSAPYGIAAGPDGNLWFTEQQAGKIGRITTTGSISEYGPTSASPYAITAGPDGNLWFVDYGNPHDYVGRITP